MVDLSVNRVYDYLFNNKGYIPPKNKKTTVKVKQRPIPQEN